MTQEFLATIRYKISHGIYPSSMDIALLLNAAEASLAPLPSSEGAENIGRAQIRSLLTT